MKKIILIISGIVIFFGLILTAIFGGAGQISIDVKNSGKGALPNTPCNNDLVSKKDFIKKVLPVAISTDNIGHIFPSITLAQAILESGWGNDQLPKRSNNLFGIKAANWTGPFIEMPTGEYYNGVKVTVMAKFRAYSSYDESILDHANFLKNNTRYAQNGVFNSTDYIAQAFALGRAGYATNPDYPMQLITLIRQYKLNQYDNYKRN